MPDRHARCTHIPIIPIPILKQASVPGSLSKTFGLINKRIVGSQDKWPQRIVGNIHSLIGTCILNARRRILQVIFAATLRHPCTFYPRTESFPVVIVTCHFPPIRRLAVCYQRYRLCKRKKSFRVNLHAGQRHLVSRTGIDEQTAFVIKERRFCHIIGKAICSHLPLSRFRHGSAIKCTRCTGESKIKLPVHLYYGRSIANSWQIGCYQCPMQ